MLLTSIGSQFWPATTEGRVLTVLLSLYGLAVFGYITAAFASFFVGRDAEPEERSGLREAHELKPPDARSPRSQGRARARAADPNRIALIPRDFGFLMAPAPAGARLSTPSRVPHPAFDRGMIVEQDFLEAARPRVAVFGGLYERARQRVGVIPGLQRIEIGFGSRGAATEGIEQRRCEQLEKSETMNNSTGTPRGSSMRNVGCQTRARRPGTGRPASQNRTIAAIEKKGEAPPGVLEHIMADLVAGHRPNLLERGGLERDVGNRDPRGASDAAGIGGEIVRLARAVVHVDLARRYPGAAGHFRDRVVHLPGADRSIFVEQRLDLPPAPAA